MSSKYMVRQPVRDPENRIIGYEMVYHGDNQAFASEKDAANEYAAADVVCSMLNSDSVKSLKQRQNFITISTPMLLKKVPKLFEPSNLVIQIDDSVVIHPLSMYFIEDYAKKGYKIAVNEFEFSPRYMSLMDTIDYIRINIQNQDEKNIKNTIELAHGMKKKCIVTHIESHQQYHVAQTLHADGFEGPYITLRGTLKPRPKNYLNSSFCKLVRETAKEVPDITAVEKMIAQDPILSYGLMKLANSEYFALHNHPSTVHQALTALGFGQLKQWVFMLCCDPAKPEENAELEEFLQVSFMRACFYRELMRSVEDISLSIGEGYLMGMFSNVDQLIDVPIQDILKDLGLPHIFCDTLVHREGPCGLLYNLILGYEIADWENVSAYARQLNISDQVVTQAYFKCLQETGDLWQKLNTSFIR